MKWFLLPAALIVVIISGCATHPATSCTSSADFDSALSNTRAQEHFNRIIEEQTTSEPPRAFTPDTIQIMGGASHPGKFRFEKDKDLAFYLAQAGVPANEHRSFKVQLIQGETGNRRVQDLEMTAAATLPARRGDVLIVHADPSRAPSRLDQAIKVAAGALTVLGAVAVCVLIV